MPCSTCPKKASIRSKRWSRRHTGWENTRRFGPSKDARDFFWHGAGRSMYFSPINFLPGFSPFRMSAQRPPDERARLSARAGAAWAFTVVNKRTPDVMANFLRQRSDEISENDAFSNGILSTLIISSDVVPNDPYVRGYCTYK